MNAVRRVRRFTLVEIMIVVMIIGLLLTIAVPSFVQARNESRKNACIANLRVIDAAKEEWALIEKKNDGDAVTMGNLVDTYIRTTPECPAGGTYKLNNIGTDPTCSITDHRLPGSAP